MNYIRGILTMQHCIYFGYTNPSQAQTKTTETIGSKTPLHLCQICVNKEAVSDVSHSVAQRSRQHKHENDSEFRLVLRYAHVDFAFATELCVHCIISTHTHTPTTNGSAVPKSSNAALFPGCCALLLASRSCPFAYRLYYPYSKSPLRCEQRRRRRRSSTGTGLCVCVCCLFWCCLCPATSAEMLMPLVDRKKSVA